MALLDDVRDYIQLGGSKLSAFVEAAADWLIGWYRYFVSIDPGQTVDGSGHINGLVILVSALMALLTFFANSRRDSSAAIKQMIDGTRADARAIRDRLHASQGGIDREILATASRADSSASEMEKSLLQTPDLRTFLYMLFAILISIIFVKSIDSLLLSLKFAAPLIPLICASIGLVVLVVTCAMVRRLIDIDRTLGELMAQANNASLLKSVIHKFESPEAP